MMMSESIKNITSAFVKAWGQIENPKHNQKVTVTTKKGQKYTFDYTDLGGIFDGIKRVFKENGIAIMQEAYTESENGRTEIFVDTMMLHSSGEWFKSKPLKLVANPNMQDLGGQITYLKRYSLSAMLGVATEKDDDVNGSLQNDFQDNGQLPENTITQEQVGQLKSKAMQFAQARNQKEQAVYDVLKIGDITQLNRAQAASAIKQLDIWLDGVKKEQANG